MSSTIIRNSVDMILDIYIDICILILWACVDFILVVVLRAQSMIFGVYMCVYVKEIEDERSVQIKLSPPETNYRFMNK